jgi:hypothetical protein
MCPAQVSNSSLPANVDKTDNAKDNGDGDDISLSDFSSAGSERLQIR